VENGNSGKCSAIHGTNARAIDETSRGSPSFKEKPAPRIESDTSAVLLRVSCVAVQIELAGKQINLVDVRCGALSIREPGWRRYRRISSVPWDQQTSQSAESRCLWWTGQAAGGAGDSWSR